MDKLLIKGGVPLVGEVPVSGAKNAALPIICASLLCGDTLTLTNVPHLNDVATMLRLIGQMGVKVIMGDLGTFDGLRTTPVGQVLKDSGEVIPGLYAVGNDRASLMGGNYPGAGITHGPNMTFGYVTAQHIADQAGKAPL